MMLVGLINLCADGTFEFVELGFGFITLMFCFVHCIFALVFLFFERCDHVLKIIRRQQFMRDALATEGTGLSVFFDKALT